MKAAHRFLLILIVLALASAACSDWLAAPDLPPAQVTPLASPQPASPAAIQIYFSDPGGPNSQSLRGGPDAALAEAIRSAQLSVDLAVLNLNLWSIRDALIEAHQRGVRVRVVIETSYLDNPEVQALIEAGIPLASDQHEALMHHKFTIIDGMQVWTGSMNYTVAAAYYNNENLLRIDSAEVARSYTAEFEEMFSLGRFGSDSRRDTPVSQTSVDGTAVEILFSPDDGVAVRLEALVAAAQTEVRFMAFSFTQDNLAAEMLTASQRGVDVAGIFDYGQMRSNQGGEYENLLAAGLDVRTDGLDGDMHHKVIIIDRTIVVLGSYNFSRSAEERNDENVLIITSPALAEAFLDEFAEIYAAGQP